MTLSVTDPIGRALDRTKHLLFKPFNLGKWFVLGFCAFLANLGEGRAGFNYYGGGGSGGRSAPIPGPTGGPAAAPVAGGAPALPPTPFSWPWIQANLHWLVPVAIVALVLLVALSLLVLWLQSRGKFMFLDGIVRNRGAVVEPWREFRTLGNSVFWFKIVFGLLCSLAYAICGGIGVAIAWPDIRAEQFGPAAALALLVSVPLLLLLVCITIPVTLLLEDFVVPAMYLRRVRVMDAWRVAWPEAVRGRFWTITLFYLMKLALGIAMAILGMIAICATCCLGALPYLSSVLLLPLAVFSRCYTLCFLEQLGPPWQFFPVEGLYCARCGYNLWQNTSGVCPGCGTPIAPEHPPVVRPPGAPPGP